MVHFLQVVPLLVQHALQVLILRRLVVHLHARPVLLVTTPWLVLHPVRLVVLATFQPLPI